MEDVYVYHCRGLGALLSNNRIDPFLARPCPVLLVFLPSRSMFGQLLSPVENVHTLEREMALKKSSSIFL